ncbi:MAG TPA: UpxY family transcription antiterminator [Candidatus Acidoferrales bacterium]|nr:UpxY family transcription antiterminator [Candidatus Acidoferrales bacterium]
MSATLIDVPAMRRSDDSEMAWYAAYTCANHERRVAEQFKSRGVEHFLPTYETVHRWKDRRVRLQLPLFPGYVFVHLALRDRLRALQVTSVVRLVGFGDEPAALTRHEIEALRGSFQAGLHAEPHPYLTPGRRVRIKSGPLTGIEGTLIRRKGRYRIVISIELIMRSIAVDIDAAEVLPLRESRRVPPILGNESSQRVSPQMPLAAARCAF